MQGQSQGQSQSKTSAPRCSPKKKLPRIGDIGLLQVLFSARLRVMKKQIAIESEKGANEAGGKGCLAASRRLCLAFSFSLAACVFGSKLAQAETTNQIAAAATPLAAATARRSIKPIDWRHHIEAKALAHSGKGTWTSPLVKAAFPFNELVLSLIHI